MVKVKENIKEEGSINTNPNGESSYENTLDYLLGYEFVAFGAFIDLLKITRQRDPDIDADMLYALEKGLRDALKDMRVKIGTLDNAYKLVPTGHKYTSDKEQLTCKSCGKKYDWQDMLRLEDMYGRYSCNECGYQKFEYAMSGGNLSEFPFVEKEV
jgi:hypothetical protein